MSISISSFTKAINVLDQTWKNLEVPTEWERVSVVKKLAIGAQPFLRIERRLQPQAVESTASGHPEEHSSSEPIHQEHDPEALIPPSTSGSPSSIHQDSSTLVVYEILHSPTYLVPVLYLTLQAPSSSPSSTIDSIYDLLVPPSFRSQLQHIGPMGALSQTEHPERGNVCWFVHPCLTQEAMKKVMVISGGVEEEGQAGEAKEWEGREVEYLMKWIGVVGGSVGLRVPVEVALAVDRRREA